ncbi:G3BP2 protein, partial [Oxylabes madagascariensis]|nr:G3BP2 protein [Oxylabes madagascariensis]
MVMEKPSPLLVGREFVRQYYTLLNKAPDFLHRFYGRNSSYVHGGLDASGKPQEAVYGQAVSIKIYSLLFNCLFREEENNLGNNFSDIVLLQNVSVYTETYICSPSFCCLLILHICLTLHVPLLQGSVPNKFYVHNDIFRYEDDMTSFFFVSESEEEVEEEQEERQPSPEPVQENASSTYYENHPVTNGIEEALEESSHEPEPELESETKAEELKADVEEKALEELEEKSPSPPPLVSVMLQRNNCPAHSFLCITPVFPPSSIKLKIQPLVETKPEAQSQPPRVREQRPRERPGFPPRGPRPGRGDMEQNESDNRRIIRYPDSHQLFVGNLPHDIDESELKEFFMSFGNVVELRINTKGVGGKLPNFGFVVFDDSEPVQRILVAKPIMFRGEVRLNVEEKKTRAARERETRGGGDERRDIRRNERGPGGPRGIVGGGMMRDRDGRGPPPRGGMAQKLGSGRGSGQMEGRFTGQRR